MLYRYNYRGYIIKRAQKDVPSKFKTSKWIVCDKAGNRLWFTDFKNEEIYCAKALERAYRWIDDKLMKSKEKFFNKEIATRLQDTKVINRKAVSIDISLTERTMKELWSKFLQLSRVEQSMLIPVMERWKAENSNWLNNVLPTSAYKVKRVGDAWYISSTGTYEETRSNLVVICEQIINLIETYGK